MLERREGLTVEAFERLRDGLRPVIDGCDNRNVQGVCLEMLFSVIGALPVDNVQYSTYDITRVEF